MKKNEKTHFRTSEKEKEKWKTFVNDFEIFNSVSEMIRFCVSKYIEGDLIERKFLRQLSDLMNNKMNFEKKADNEDIEFLKQIEMMIK